MKKAKNEITKLCNKSRVDFEHDDKIKKVPSVQKQKKPLSIYDNFDDEEEVDDLFDIENDEEIDDYSDDEDYYDLDEMNNKEESIWDYMDDDE
jgi:hypothetical protein